jgi:hypothetical protein
MARLGSPWAAAQVAGLGPLKWNFRDVPSTIMLVATRLRHVAATEFGTKRYLQMDQLAEVVAIA